MSGALLYAKTDEAVPPSGTAVLTGSAITVTTIDLSADFQAISTQLLALADGMLGEG